jgi:hypothetical protein
VDKNSNLENGVRFQMDEFNLVAIKDTVEKVADWEGESALEEGREHHNLSCIGCRNVFPGGQIPLPDGMSCESHFHLRQMAGRDAGARRPSRGREITTAWSWS